GTMADDALPDDGLDRREALASSFGDGEPVARAGPAREVVERERAGPGRLADDDPTYHPGGLVGEAEVVVDPLDRERDLEVVAFLQEKARVPRLGLRRDAERVLPVARMVGSGRVRVARRLDDPAHPLARWTEDRDRIEPDVLPPGVAPHPDLDERCGATRARRGEAGDREAACAQELSSRHRAPAYLRLAAFSGETYQTTM